MCTAPGYSRTKTKQTSKYKEKKTKLRAFAELTFHLHNSLQGRICHPEKGSMVNRNL